MPLDSPFLERVQSELIHDLFRFTPELAVCGGIVTTLVGRMIRPAASAVPLGGLTILLSLAFLALDWPAEGKLFEDLLVYDRLTSFLRCLILLSALGTLVLARLTGWPDAADSSDFVVLVLGSTLGLMMLPGANHWLMVFVAVEMAGLPGYLLSGFRKRDGRAGEAALKYVVFGAAATGVMVYGMSLLAGRFGGGFHDCAVGIRDQLAAGGVDLPLAIGALFVAVGVGFKLAVVPVHAWLPDVFDGATAEVAGFLAVASKIAAVGLLLRLTLTFAELAPGPFRNVVGPVLVVVGLLTATVGNLIGLAQTNLKRLLAYSTIAHAGYLVMGTGCQTSEGTAAVLYFLAAYTPTTLGAFAVAAVMRSRGGDDFSALTGLVTRSPALGVGLVVCLFGLLGVPPLAGFIGKFQVFTAIYHTADGHPYGGLYRWAVAGAVVNTLIGAGYYLKVLRVIGLDAPPEQPTEQPADTPVPLVVGWYVSGLAIAVVVLGVWVGPVVALARVAAE